MQSPSARKVWIEMCSVRTFTRYASASPSARKVWIEIGLINCGVCGATSHLPRGRCGLKLECVPLLGVIESHLPRGRCGLKYVSLSRSEELYIVTFREEGVDWNHHCAGASDRYYVTFRKEGVDWNGIILAISPLMWSPSVRKVWIEIFVNSVIWYCTSSPSTRKVWIEIDRTTYIELLDTSPSARKMWIEIGEQGKWVFWVLRHILQMDPISQIW